MTVQKVNARKLSNQFDLVSICPGSDSNQLVIKLPAPHTQKHLVTELPIGIILSREWRLIYTGTCNTFRNSTTATTIIHMNQ